MNGAQHFLIGAATTGSALWVAGRLGDDIGSVVIAAGAAVGGLGALVPDIDHPHSTISHGLPRELLRIGVDLFLPFALLTGLLAVAGGVESGFALVEAFVPFLRWGASLLVVGGIMLGLSLVARALFAHRGATHSLTFAVGATVFGTAAAVGAGAAWWYGVLFGIGWFTHVAADATTHHGVPDVLWPFAASAVPYQSRSSHIAGGVFVAALALVALGWTAGHFVQRVVDAPVNKVSAEHSEPEPALDASLARARLEEASPEIAAALVDPAAPATESRDGLTYYTWEYLEQAAADQVTVKQITIVLDSQGRIVGADTR